MKKYLLASIAILFAAAFVWAEEATIQQPDIDVDADATVSWGIDLGSGDISEKTIKHGFKNTDSWTVKFPLIKKGDRVSAKSEAPVYGEVKLTDIELNIQSKHDENGGKFTPDGKVDGLKAKLVFYGAYLQVYNKPGFASNYANLWEPLKKSSDYDDKEDDVIYKFKPSFTGYGTKIGYANADLMDLDVGLKFGSNGNWEAKDADDPKPVIDKSALILHDQLKAKDAEVPKGEEWVDRSDNKHYVAGEKVPAGYYDVYTTKPGEKGKDDPHSKYAIGLDFSMKPLDKMLALELTVNSTFNVAKDYKAGKADERAEDSVMLNVGAKVKSEPIDALKFTLGFDGGSLFKKGNPKDEKTFAWDLLFSTEYKWVGAGVYVASAGTPYADHNGKDNNKDIADMAMYVKFETKGDKKEASNLVEGLDAGAHLGLYRLLTLANQSKTPKMQLPMLLKLWGSYKVSLNDSMSLKPFATLWVETNHYETTANATKKTADPYVGIAYDVGLTYSPVEKVEVTAKWAHGKLRNNEYGDSSTASKHKGLLIEAPVNNKAHNGTFTLALKIKF